MATATSPLVLPPNLVKIAEAELGETPEVLRTSLAELRSRIAALPEADRLADTSDDNVVRFLRARKFDLDEALARTVDYTRFYKKHSEAVKSMRSEEFGVFSSFCTVLKDHDPDGRVCVVMQPKKGIGIFTKDFLKQHPRAMLAFNVWMFERLSHDPYVQVCGLRVFNTFRGMTMGDQMAMQNMAPMSDQLATFQFFQLLGLRFGGAHIFEQPMIMGVIWSLARPFLSEKLRQRFHLCGKDYSKVAEVLPDSSVVPECLGGGLADLQYDWVAQQIALEAAAAAGEEGGAARRGVVHL